MRGDCPCCPTGPGARQRTRPGMMKQVTRDRANGSARRAADARPLRWSAPLATGHPLASTIRRHASICRVSSIPTSANSTCDFPEILPLLSILTTFNCAGAPRCTTMWPSLVSGVTTVAESSSPTVALSELKSVSRRTTTDLGADIAADDLACWLPDPPP